ncbi:hypothetical protein V3C99_007300 [Haemonchus contortus]
MLYELLLFDDKECIEVSLLLMCSLTKFVFELFMRVFCGLYSQDGFLPVVSSFVADWLKCYVKSCSSMMRNARSITLVGVFIR